MAIDINIPSQVKNYANLAGFPATGALKTIYIANDTNKTYRWTGSAYVEISATSASTWGTITGTLSSQTDLQTALNAKVTGNTAITGATKTKVTYDSKGLVTSGADATTADIADSTNKRYVTDANLTTIGNTSGTNTGDNATNTQYSGLATSKQDTLVSGTNIKTVNGTTILGSGDLTISTGITIGTTAITSGTVGRVLFQGTGNVVQQSSSLFWDSTNNRLGIGTSSPLYPLDVNGMGRVQGQFLSGGGTPLALTGESFAFQTVVASGPGGSVFGTNGSNPSFIDILSNNNFWHISNRSLGYNDRLGIYNATFTGATATYTSELFTFHKTGNFSINTTTDAGFKLDVNGTARVSGPSTYSMVYDVNGVLNLNGTYARLDLFNASGSLRARLNCDGPNGTLTLCQNASGYVFLNGSQSANDNFINGAVSIGKNSAAATSSILELTSTTKGVLFPRMTSAQRTAISSPAVGLVVYQTDATEGLYINKSTGWALLL